jgi:hypothetical protein
MLRPLPPSADEPGMPAIMSRCQSTGRTCIVFHRFSMQMPSHSPEQKPSEWAAVLPFLRLRALYDDKTWPLVFTVALIKSALNASAQKLRHSRDIILVLPADLYRRHALTVDRLTVYAEAHSALFAGVDADG